MKKTAILAVSLLAVAVVAVWFGREQQDREQVSSPVVDAAEPSPSEAPPARADDSVTATEVEHSTATVSGVESESPTELFGEPRDRGLSYLNATREVAEIMNAEGRVGFSQTRIVQLDRAAIARFFGLATSAGLLVEQFDLTMFPEARCTITSISRSVPIEREDAMTVHARCSDASPRHSLTARYDRRSGDTNFTFNSGDGLYLLKTLQEPGFALLVKVEPSSLPQFEETDNEEDLLE